MSEVKTRILNQWKIYPWDLNKASRSNCLSFSFSPCPIKTEFSWDRLRDGTAITIDHLDEYNLVLVD